MGNKFLRIANGLATAIGLLVLCFSVCAVLGSWFLCFCFNVDCESTTLLAYVSIISCIVAVPYVYLIVKGYWKRVDTWLYTIAGAASLGMQADPLMAKVLGAHTLFILFFSLGVIATFYHFFQARKSFKNLPASETTPAVPLPKAIPAPATVPPVKESRTITPLLEAILSGNADNVRAALTEHPEHLNTAYAQNGNTPLHVAALNGKTEIVNLLLAQPGIDKTRKNNEGKTARDLAQERNFPEIIGLL